MSLVTFAALNGVLAVGILAALTYVCLLPFRLDLRREPAGSTAGSAPRRPPGRRGSRRPARAGRARARLLQG